MQRLIAAALRRWRLQRPATFTELRKQLGEAKRPLHYLAMPPSLFATVAEALRKSGCAENARLVIEKPFGHNRAYRARAEPTVGAVLPRGRTYSGSTTISARSRCRTSSTRASPTRSSSRSGTGPRPQHPDHHGGEFRRRRTAATSTTRPARSATWCRTTCCRCWRN